jgi:nitrite reductase/ring-hydroxylating ferredoxin subunit
MEETTRNWIRICGIEDLPTDKASELTIGSQRLTIARCEGNAYIFQGYCSHMLFPLSGSKVENCVMTCALHHSTFNVQDGSVIEWSSFPPLIGSALAAIRQRKALRTYETKVEENVVYILWATSEPDSVTVKVKPA